VPYLREHPGPTEQEIREALSGNLCRCTGYKNIVDAVALAARRGAAAGRQGAPAAPARRVGSGASRRGAA